MAESIEEPKTKTEITYEDIKNTLSPNALTRYNDLCRQFVRLVEGKNNSTLWHELEKQCELSIVLDEIHKIKQDYDLIVVGKPFFSVWQLDPKINSTLKKAWG